VYTHTSGLGTITLTHGGDTLVLDIVNIYEKRVSDNTIHIVAKCKVSAVTGAFLSLQRTVEDELDFQIRPSVNTPIPTVTRPSDGVIQATATEVANFADFTAAISNAIVEGSSAVSVWHNDTADSYANMDLQCFMEIKVAATDGNAIYFQDMDVRAEQIRDFGTVDLAHRVPIVKSRSGHNYWDGTLGNISIALQPVPARTFFTQYRAVVNVDKMWEWTDGDGKHLVMRRAAPSNTTNSGGITMWVDGVSHDIVAENVGTFEARIDPYVTPVLQEPVVQDIVTDTDFVDMDGFKDDLFTHLNQVHFDTLHTFSLWERGDTTDTVVLWGEITL
jgi:hypothetical protein